MRSRHAKFQVGLIFFAGLAFLTILLLGGELVLLVEKRLAISAAEEYARNNKHIFAGGQFNELADGRNTHYAG